MTKEKLKALGKDFLKFIVMDMIMSLLMALIVVHLFV